ncbi:MAG: hypothetical protein J5852_05150, partial [Clostridia bacterium]|nr:hypothetical protein [Clostridia bacterium]
MKRFIAATLSILFILLCGCSSNSGFFSDFSDFSEMLGESIHRTYRSINDTVSEAISGVIPESGIDKDDIISIVPVEITYDGNDLKAYKQLTAKQKRLYSVMLTAVKNMELKNIEVTKYLTGDGFSDSIIAHRALMCDRPDIFWMPKKISVLSLEGKKNKYISFKDYYAEKEDIGFYGITKQEKEQMEVVFNEAVNSIVPRAAAFGNSFEKELYLHDYLCEHITYDKEAADDLENANRNSLTAYGALVDGKAICEGYAKAMQLLCIKCGIPCNVVFGEHEGVSHMWNVVNPGDGLYYLDVTFDDSSSDHILHMYFNVTKEQILLDHKFDESYSPENIYDGTASFNFFTDDCKNTVFNYFEWNEAYVDEDCKLAINNIIAAMDEGKNSAEL